MITLNNREKINKSKIRVGRGIGSGKGKTSGRGHKGQKSRSGVAVKSFEGGQMPLYRRLPKRGFKSLSKKDTAIINLSSLQVFYDSKLLDLKNPIDLKILKEKKIVNKKFSKLKVLGNGDIKNKINISANFISKQAKSKIEKAGGTLNIINSGIDIPFMYIGQAFWPNDTLNYSILNQFTENNANLNETIFLQETKHYDFSDTPHLSKISKKIGLSGSMNSQSLLDTLNYKVRTFFNSHLIKN